jgi:hypothetical protein
LVTLAWVFFRAATVDQALEVLGGLVPVDLTADVDRVGLVPLAALAVILVDVSLRRRVTVGARPERNVVAAGVGVGLAVMALLAFSGREPVPFVYFQF